MLSITVICTFICIIAGIFDKSHCHMHHWWYLLFVTIIFYVQTTAVLLESNVATIIFKCTLICSIAVIVFWYQLLLYENHKQYGRFLLMIIIIVICTYICSIAGIYCCKQSFLYVQKSAGMLESIVAK